MALFGRRAPGSGIEGTAVIVDSRREGEPFQHGEPWPWEIGLNRHGRRRYWFVLEVRIPGRDPYQVTGEFKVPRRVENVSFFNVANQLGPGLELPVRVDESDSAVLAIDWERFESAPGRKQAVRAAAETARRGAMRRQLESKPELAQKMRANNRQAVEAWVSAVRAGHVSREQFERTVDLEVEAGRMDPADAEAGRRALEEEDPPLPVSDPEESERIRADGRKTSATVLQRTDTGREHRGGPVHRLQLDVEGRRLIHHEVLNDRWAALLEPGMQTTVYVDPGDPGRIALG